MVDKESVNEVLASWFVDCGEREVPGSLAVGDTCKESAKEALSCCFVDSGKRDLTIYYSSGQK